MDTETKELLTQILAGMDAGFLRVDQRFEAVDRRFDAADRRFDALETKMHDGFESVDERLGSLERDANTLMTQSGHHTLLLTALTERVAALDKRVDSMSDQSYGVHRLNRQRPI